jgi:hypothetical protein
MRSATKKNLHPKIIFAKTKNISQASASKSATKNTQEYKSIHEETDNIYKKYAGVCPKVREETKADLNYEACNEASRENANWDNWCKGDLFQKEEDR